MKTVAKKYIGIAVTVLSIVIVFTSWQLWSKKNFAPPFTTTLPTQQPAINGPAFISRANEITSFQNLTLSDFPLLRENSQSLYGQVWKYNDDRIFTFWNTKEIAIFDSKMHLKAISNAKLVDCEVDRSVQTGEYFFVICSDSDKKIYMINLEKNTVEYTFNLSGMGSNVVVQGDFLWIWTGQWDRVNRINFKTKQLTTYTANDFPKPSSAPSLPPTNNFNLSIDNLVASSTGTYIQYRFSSYDNKKMLNFYSSSSTTAKFDVASEKWIPISSVIFAEKQRTSPHTFRSSKSEEKKDTDEVFSDFAKIDLDNQELVFPLHSLRYLALTEPVDGIRYLLSPLGIEKFSEGDRWPVLVKPLKWEWTAVLEHYVEAIVSPDKKFLLFLINYTDSGEGVEYSWTQISLYNLQTDEVFSSARKSTNVWYEKIRATQDQSKIIISSESAGSIAEVDLTKKSIRFLKK